MTKTNKNKRQRLEGLPVTVRWHFSQTRVVARSHYHGSGVGTHLLHSTCAMSPSSAEGSSSRLLPYFPSPYAHSHQVTHFFSFFFLLVISMATDKASTLCFSHLGCKTQR